MTQVKQATEQDQLTEIESLYANTIKLLKHLREPGIIRHVETRREYQLKATQLDYRYIDNRQIRIYAKKLLKCADKVCEKHLYHDDIKQAFRQDIQYFANDIVNQVDNGSITYEQGVQKIKKEEDSLWEQSFEWLSRGLSILGGTGLLMAGAAMCTTGVGCIVGAYLGAHGVNSIQEGVFGGDGFLKSTYQEAAKQLGMSESVGSLVYDMVDLGISVKGKLKLVPKLNEFDSPVFKLWHYGRQDLVRTYTQMSNKLLYAEIASDILTLSSVISNAQNVFILDQNKQETSISISTPESITNVGEIIEDCSLVIRITGDSDSEQPHYYLCTKLNGEKYRKYYDGHVENGGMLP